MDALIGVDVGATSISAGLVTRDGEVSMVVRAASRGNGPTTAVDTVLALVRGLVAEARDRSIALEGVGIGLPGLVDAEKGMMIDAVNLMPEFAHVPLVQLLHAATGLPVYVDNDVNVLALGEHRFGVGRGADSLVALAIGTGPGGAIIIGNRLVRGHSGCAGEFGHIPMGLDGPPCVCGGHGCLNLWVGGHAIAERARNGGRVTSSMLGALAGGDVSRITAEMVFRAASAGDTVARTIVEEACRALGFGLATIVNSLNPEVLVVTGGVATSLVAIEDEVRGHAARYALPRALAGTRIHIVPGDKRRTLVGGAALVLYEQHRT